MSTAKRRYSSLIMFSVTLLLAVGISSAMYFFKIQKNEDYQNRLHFRELNEVSRSIIQSVSQLSEIAKVCQGKKTEKSVDTQKYSQYTRRSDYQASFTSCESLLKKRVALANQSSNLKNLKLSNQSLPVNQEDESFSIQMMPGGKTLVQVTSEFTDEKRVLEVATEDFVPMNIERFPLVLIANADGTVIGNKQVNRKGVETADLQFQDVASLFSQLAEQRPLASAETERGKGVNPTTSEILVTTIGGVDYRIFIQPFHVSNVGKQSSMLYLLGLVPANELRLAKLSVSPNTALWFVLILIGLVALLPVIKLRFVSVKYAFSRGDVSQIGLGLLVALGMVSIGITHQLFYGYLMDEKAEQASLLHQQISEEFTTEINTLNTWVKDYQSKLVDNKDDQSFDYCVEINVSEATREGRFDSCVDPNLLVTKDDTENGYEYLIEGTFVLNQEGRFARGSRTTWKKHKLLVGRDITLTHRKYFQQAIACNVWGETGLGTDCSNGFVFERINNVRDGRKNTQFAIPMFDSADEDNKRILSFGTRLRTFFHRVMPKDFGYLVFDNAGNVVFHSDEQRSLIENVFVETDNNKQLHAFVASKQVNAEQISKTIDFEVVYRGKSHLFSVGNLFTDNTLQSAPLSLVVFFDQTHAELNNMLLLFLAVILFLLIIIPLFIFFRYTTSQAFWATLLYYNPRHAKRYLSWFFLVAGGAVFCLFMMGVIFDLAWRIGTWLFTACFLFKLIVYSLNSKKTVLRGDTPSLKPALAIAVLFLFIGWRVGLVPSNLNAVNIVFFILGLATFAGAIVYQIKRPQVKMTAEDLYRRERYTKAYVSYLVAIVFFTAAVPASLIVNSANGYLLQHQAAIQSQHIQIAEQHYQQQLVKYDAVIGIEEDSKFGQYIAKNWRSEPAIGHLFPGLGEWIEPVFSEEGSGRHTDKMIQFLVSNIAFADALLAEITMLAKVEKNFSDEQVASSAEQEDKTLPSGPEFLTTLQSEQDKSISSLHYLPDAFMLNASNSNILFILFAMFIQILVLHRIVELMIVRRLFGDHLTNDFRISYPTEHYCLNEKWDALQRQLTASAAQHILLLHSNGERVHNRFAKNNLRLYQNSVLNVKNLLKQVDEKFEIECNLEKKTGDSTVTLALEGYDELAFLSEKRNLALALTQRLMAMPRVHLLIVADTAPIYRLIKQDEYPHLQEESVALATEELAWANVFSRFSKIYDWTPAKKYMPRNVDDVRHLIENESNGWPELDQIKETFEEYHKLVKLDDPKAQLTASNLKTYWKPSQIIAFFAMHGGALYRMKWELCTKDERFLLYQLASGANVNPLNAEVVEHLMRRGYIYRDAGWHIINESFKRFVLHAEREESILDWQADANTGIWSMLRIPIFTVVLVLIVVTVFSSGQAIDSALGIMTAVLGMIPLLLRNVSLLKGGTTNLGE